MNFGTNKSPTEVIKEGSFGGTYLEIFILMLIINGTKIVGKNLVH